MFGDAATGVLPGKVRDVVVEAIDGGEALPSCGWDSTPVTAAAVAGPQQLSPGERLVRYGVHMLTRVRALLVRRVPYMARSSLRQLALRHKAEPSSWHRTTP